MICPNCGKTISDESKFCTKCGYKIETSITNGYVDTQSTEEPYSNVPIEIGGASNDGNNSEGKQEKAPFVWKDQYTYISIGVGILLAAIIGFAVKMNKSSKADYTTNNAVITEESRQESEFVNNDYEDVENNLSERSLDINERTIEETEAGNSELDDKYSDDILHDEGIHTYELVVSDVTWTEAYEQCLRMEGHLVRINSDDEYKAILNQIYSEGKENIKFWIGGCRDENGNYCWVYNDKYDDRYDYIMGDVILNSDPVYQNYWLEGEPSFYDDATETEENCMNMFYLKSLERWVWNDVPDDVLAVASFYSGSMGFICEYE